MALCTDDLQTACLSGHIVQLNIRTTAGHIGGNGNSTRLTGMGYDLSLHLMELGIQYLVLDAFAFQHAA